MTSSGAGHEARGNGREQSPSRFLPLAARLTPLASSCAALVVVFSGLSQLDLPITRYVRSVTVHLPWDHLTIPWMAFTSDAGDWIGQGWRLIAVSVVLLAIGWGFSKAVFKTTGIDTLLAHGIAALLSNGLKHVIGRPRPKFVHSGDWQFAPSWASGLDSFPSGHTTATFAVATVLAKRFPAWSVIFIGIAAFVGLSRVLRGSHFPTDVFGGAVLGVLSGSLAAAPWKAWRESLRDGLFHAGIGTVVVFSLLWTLARPAEGGIERTIFFGLGVLSLASGLWLRVRTWIGKERSTAEREQKASLVLIAYGLASLTASPLIIASVGLACLAFWFHDAAAGLAEQESASRFGVVIAEGVLAVGVLVVLLILFEGRGVLPFQ